MARQPHVPQPETELEEFFELSIDPLSIVGFDGEFKRVNASFLRLMGYSKPELFSRSVLDLLHPDDVERAREALAKVVEGHDVVAFEARVICADGAVRWLEWSTRTMPERGVIYSIGRDTTERRRAEAELREAQRVLETSRDELRVLADEQAALRRVATLVAQDVPPKELFAAVTREVGTLLGADFSGMIRYEDDASVMTVATWAAVGEHPPVPERWPIEPGDPASMILESRATARVEDWASVPGPIAETIRNVLGVNSSVGCPIVVEGRLWGALAAHSKQSQPLPPDTESRIAQFTDLIGTAIANAESRGRADRLAEEQAALRRVATLVAKEASPAEVFAKVAEEVANVLGEVECVLLRDEGDGTALTVAAWGAGMSPRFPVGTGVRVGGDGVLAFVLREGRPRRIDDYSAVGESTAEAARDHGIGSAVGHPIVVGGRIWGAIVAARFDGEPCPSETERHIARFADLVATAIANAEARAEVERLAAEQAALRRVATLVAEGASPSAVLDAVAAEMERALGADAAMLLRYEPDEEATVVAGRVPKPRTVPVGTRVSHEGENVTSMVRRTGRPGRIGDYRQARGPIADLARAVESNVSSAVGAPIVVDGRLWGVIVASWESERSPPGDTEERMVNFAQLLETAIANAESREARAVLTEEQAALRRVATLVAQGASPQDIFEAVAEEVGRLLPVGSATMGRFEPDDSVTSVASWSTTEALAFPTGVRWRTEGTNVAWMVLQTGRTARIDDFSAATDPIGVAVRETGIKSAVGSPIVVKGHLWGVVAAASTDGPLPPDTEARLASFTELVATAIANAKSSGELAASRRRIVAASDDARRRVVRDLHDGAQQRLVHTIVTLKRAQRAVRHEDGTAESLLSEALEQAEQGNRELRELAHGILPAVLTRGGIRAGVDAVVARLDLPVRVDVPAERLSAEIEASAYFIVAEALTNVVKHSHAEHAEVNASLEAGMLRIEVRDDGAGGADPDGRGLVGMRDRVTTLGGRLEIESHAGAGTRVAATLPLSAG